MSYWILFYVLDNNVNSLFDWYSSFIIQIIANLSLGFGRPNSASDNKANINHTDYIIIIVIDISQSFWNLN